MDCNPPAPSTSKNTNMNIRRKKTTKKQKKINVETWQLVPELASSQTLASLEGTGQALTCCCEEKLKPYSLNDWGGGGADMSTGVFPSNEAVRCGNAPLVLGVFEHNTKIWAGSTRWFFSTCLWQNTTRTTDTAELNTKGRLQCHVSYKCFNFKTDH